jgi:hypothetical protein
VTGLTANARTVFVALALVEHDHIKSMGALNFRAAVRELQNYNYIARVPAMPEAKPTGQYMLPVPWVLTGAGLDKLAELGVRWELEDPMPELLEGSHE